jgi:outer membrane protein assembly factor BamB
MRKTAIETTIVLAFLVMACFTVFSKPNVQAASISDDWPMFHHDLAHTGYSTSSAPTTPVVLWTSPKGYGGSPVVSNGYVYTLDTGTIYCFRASDGHQVWNRSLSSGLPESAPAVYSGYVYTPLTAYNASTGELALNYSSYQGYSSPTVAEGILYFGSHFGKSLFALNATTGSKIWNYRTGGDVTSSPTIAYGRVYFESWDGNIYSVDALTGTKIWSYKLNEPTGYMDSSPAIVGEHVYVGARDNVYCLDALTGDKVWNYSIPGVRSSPVVASGHVYVGSIDSNMYALNASSGAQIWNVSGGSSSSPAVADSVVYIGDIVRIIAFNASTGNKIWNFTFPPTEYYGISSPAILNGVIYAAGGDAIYAFGNAATAAFSQSPELLLEITLLAIIVAASSILIAKKYLTRKKQKEQSSK